MKEDSYVVCPYYRKEDPISIKCAGVIGEHTISEFFNKKAKEEYKDNFCKEKTYAGCPIYIALSQEEA